MSLKSPKWIKLFLIAVCCVTLTFHFTKKPYFSIIVCSYNYGHYLPQTIDSVLNSTFKSYELIVVNDGSTDKTSEVLKKYKDHPQITIIEHENMGLSLSRNKAMKIAKGKYFWFVDADDWIDQKALERLYKKTKKDIPDMVSFYTGAVNEKGQFLGIAIYDKLPYQLELGIKDIYTIDDFQANELIWYPVTSGKQIYRREFIQKNNIEFPAKTLFEDDVFFLHTLFSDARIGAIPSVLYYKRAHSKAITADKAKYFDSFTRICQYIWERTHINPKHQEKATTISNIYFSAIPGRWRSVRDELRYKFYPDLIKLKEFVDKQPDDDYWTTKKQWYNEFLSSPDVSKYKEKL